jgi:glycosyltransferase involved in cell wall biosynthesis
VRDRYVLAVGDIYLHKNYGTLIEAFALYRREFGGTLNLRIVGEAIDVRCRSALVDLIQRLDAGDFVSLAGKRGPAEVQLMYRSAMLFVTASLTESFGLTPLEAMSAGLPVIAARASGTPEICGTAAIYFDPSSPRELAELIRSLEIDGDLRDRLRSAGILRAAQFSWAKTASEYADVIESAIERSCRPARAPGHEESQ